MKHAGSLNRLTLAGLLALLSACSPSRNSQAPAPVVGGPAQNQVEGSSSGGGSFGDESSLKILRWAADDLSAQIANSSPEIYKNLPQGWTQAKLAQVIRDVEPVEKNRDTYRIPEISRYGQRLMFNYGKKDDGTPFITATKLFTDAYSHFEVNSRPRHEFGATLEEVKLKLAHEASHLMGLGVTRETDMTEARKFAKSLLAALDSDNMECLPDKPLPYEMYTAFAATAIPGGLNNVTYSSETPEEKQLKEKEFLEAKVRAYVFNRPTGRAATPNNWAASCYQAPDPKIPGSIGYPRHCRPGDDQNLSSGHISVFAPKTYGADFTLKTVIETIKGGARDYGYPEGYFSWKTVDLRNAVLTDEGYKSNYKYEHEQRMNDKFHDYMDFFVVNSSAQSLEIESYPALKQEEWSVYRSGGRMKIMMNFDNGVVVGAKILLIKAYSEWLEKEQPNDFNIEVPMTCVRSYKPL